MGKILFVGDPHINASTPASRKDVYSTTVLNKIRSIGKLVEERNIGAVIYLGDMFSAKWQPITYVIDAIDALNTIKCPQYSIIGNHDLVYERIESFDSSPLSLLQRAGVVNILGELNIDDKVLVKGFNYTDNLSSKEFNGFKVCVAHCFYNNERFGGTNHNLNPEDALKLGYQAYVLGHDHTPYPDVENSAFKVIRPGSLMRGSSHEYNLKRGIEVVEFDSDSLQFTHLPLPCDKPEDVFRERVYVEKEQEPELTLDEVIKNLDYAQDDSIYSILDEAEMPEKNRQLICKYLEAHGIYRTTV